MFSNKHNVNVLTSLLLAHNVRSAVLCPGSRNAPLVHNLVSAGLHTYAVTDERSAGFFALGLALREGPVAVCVTSGSALLNLLPSVAEAFYQHVPLLVISADRPQAWIGQQDGQTLPQPGALAPYVLSSVSLPEPHDGESQWYCNRLVNEALLAMHTHGGGPVHINVPVSEPLYGFSSDSLPCERSVSLFAADSLSDASLDRFFRLFDRARRPMIVFGQNRFDIDTQILSAHAVVLSESLSLAAGLRHADGILLRRSADPDGFDRLMAPDLVLYAGGTVVSRRLREFLRSVPSDQYFISPSSGLCDTFRHLSAVIRTDPSAFFQALSQHLLRRSADPDRAFIGAWQHADVEIGEGLRSATLPFSSVSVVRSLERHLDRSASRPRRVYANSSAVRLANLFAPAGIYCNRGVNGIEGSLSTAVGLAADGIETCCVIGDLSFFYDQNALWNGHVSPNLRILLLNNGGGSIFGKFDALKESPARDRFVMARHRASARGICDQCGILHLSASDSSSFERALTSFLRPSDSPQLLEVLTDPDDDWNALSSCLSQAAAIVKK